MDTNLRCCIDFYFSSPFEQCECRKITFTSGNKAVPFVAKRHKKDKTKDAFPWEAGAIAFTIVMLRFKVENKPDRETHDVPLARRGTIEASAYDVIEKAHWLPDGFGCFAAPTDEPQIFRLRQSTKHRPKMVGIQVDTNLLAARDVHFHQTGGERELTRQQLKTLEISLTRAWREHQRPSRNRRLAEARKIVTRRIRKSGKRYTMLESDGSLRLIPPSENDLITLAEAFPAASIEGKIAMLNQDLIPLIPLLEECVQLTEKEKPDTHLRLLTTLAALNYQKHHLQEACSYAKRLANLGNELGDPYAAQLGQALTEHLQKHLAS